MMPNLPVAIGQGVTALYTSSTDAAVRDAAEALARPLGLAPWVEDEARFDAVTALAGCGPAFVFRFIDALAQAGVGLGLSPELAQQLALATVDGAGAMAIGADAPPAVLADRVASPGGSTREGLNVLDADDALQAAHGRDADRFGTAQSRNGGCRATLSLRSREGAKPRRKLCFVRRGIAKGYPFPATDNDKSMLELRLSQLRVLAPPRPPRAFARTENQPSLDRKSSIRARSFSGMNPSSTVQNPVTACWPARA